jgi:hypothetical protein
LKTGTTLTGIIYVNAADLSVFTKAYGVKEPTKGPGLKGEPNICADYDHGRTGTTLTGLIRVSAADLSRFTAAYTVKEPPKGTGVPVCTGITYIDPAWPIPVACP